MVNAEKYKDIITTMIETNISDSAVKNGKPNYRISEDLKERLSYKLLSFNEENFQEISRLILEAEVI